MTYDTWKATEPDYGDERPEEGEEEMNMDPRHLELPDLDGLKTHRPRLSLWIDENEDEDKAKSIAMSIDALWGQQQRFVDLLPAEARKLASYLIELADAVDSLAGRGVYR